MAAVFNNCDYCISEQNRPVPTHLPSLQTIIHRYAQVADEVNQKEFKRFTQEIRAKWHPLPPAQDEWEEGYRGEGWTDEGAFTLCVYQLSTGSDKPHREEGPLCEAEKRNQVLFRRPLESLIDDYWKKPLREPLLENEIVEGLARLRDGVQRQLSEDAADVDLPEDFESLMRITNGVHGAGVPSETAYTVLVKPLGAHSVERYMPGEGPNSSEGAEVTFWRQDGFTPFAAWKIGELRESASNRSRSTHTLVDVLTISRRLSTTSTYLLRPLSKLNRRLRTNDLENLRQSRRRITNLRQPIPFSLPRNGTH